jgi:prepilin-type N-terminal cleavage/methylation domain-containing protein
MSSQKGFTLLETVVTLVIVSLIVAVLMQALGQALSMRSRILRYQRDSRIASLQQQWFRDSVEGAVVDAPEALGALSGRPERLEFVSAAPLGGPGVQKVRWSLDRVDGGVALHYTDRILGDIQVVPGPLQEATFDYMDAQGTWKAEWVPEPGAPEVMPRLVRLRARGATAAIEWLAPVHVDPVPPGSSGWRK